MTLPSFAAEWLTDVPTALAKAKRENKFVLLDFTGSDWCGWCIRLKKEVFDQPAFATFADANLVLVELDFPEHKAQSPALKQANANLARTYGIRGYPTVIILDANGKTIEKTGYIKGGPGAFIANLEKISGMKHVSLPPPQKENEAAEPEKPHPPVSIPVGTTNSIRYTELALKGISGTKDRRMALINNETFFVGEIAKVKVKDGRVEVQCKEIREDSVCLTVDGKPMVLKLGKN
ncbi:MAG: trxA [Pedosphaera sp.]|nr:trxA [Pedosphaera sp.]